MKINEILEKLNISRPTLYRRLEALEVTPLKDSEGRAYITPEQFQQLEELSEWAKEHPGAGFKAFTPKTPVSVQRDSTDGHVVKLTETDVSQFQQVFDPDSPLMQVIEAIALAHHIPSISARHEQLEKFAANGWILTSSEVKLLIGTKPRGSTFQRGCWLFEKAGRLGIEAGWSVTKI